MFQHHLFFGKVCSHCAAQKRSNRVRCQKCNIPFFCHLVVALVAGGDKTIFGTCAALLPSACLWDGPIETRRPPWASFTARLSTTVASSVTTSVLLLRPSSLSIVTILSMLWLPVTRNKRSSIVAVRSCWITWRKR